MVSVSLWPGHAAYRYILYSFEQGRRTDCWESRCRRKGGSGASCDVQNNDVEGVLVASPKIETEAG